ncbi:hypothetical protein WN55_07326 [Dufourea novaeangliae]|uniref:Uncharacterized protein n=1 Tax=Dufourea novaeangliae TaxID=178035 RepID=A0A154PS06_DUFNO|nr:hypothetical protein WN55_07326 [Dufourea novaeangliae]
MDGTSVYNCRDYVIPLLGWPSATHGGARGATIFTLPMATLGQQHIRLDKVPRRRAWPRRSCIFGTSNVLAIQGFPVAGRQQQRLNNIR